MLNQANTIIIVDYSYLGGNNFLKINTQINTQINNGFISYQNAINKITCIYVHFKHIFILMFN